MVNLTNYTAKNLPYKLEKTVVLEKNCENCVCLLCCVIVGHKLGENCVPTNYRTDEEAHFG